MHCDGCGCGPGDGVVVVVDDFGSWDGTDCHCVVSLYCCCVHPVAAASGFRSCSDCVGDSSGGWTVAVGGGCDSDGVGCCCCCVGNCFGDT